MLFKETNTVFRRKKRRIPRGLGFNFSNKQARRAEFHVNPDITTTGSQIVLQALDFL